MHVAVVTIEIHLPGCNSLKEKRSKLKPLLARLQREFNISTAELEHNDVHRSAGIACAVVGNNDRHLQRMLEKIPGWIERHRPDLQVVDHQIILL
ncbi:MAG: DUF503 domain-containing protein [Anaerolineales bacterium]|nr:DUF503 domain-containing protein [Anaerolineales bacterium]